MSMFQLCNIHVSVTYGLHVPIDYDTYVLVTYHNYVPVTYDLNASVASDNYVSVTCNIFPFRILFKFQLNLMFMF